ncbi:FAD:protein FMN transferase [bacterium]|nr:FAD:protein FMN transferase [bacterium]
MPKTLNLGTRFVLTFLVLFALTACDKQVIPVDEDASAAEAPAAGKQKYDFTGQTMGTSYKVSVVSDPLDQVTQQELAEAIKARAEEVNHAMSTYIADSDVTRISQAAANEPVSVSPMTVTVVKMAIEVAQASDGAFDPTVAPLVALWGFGADKSIEEPSPAQIREASARVDYRTLQVDEAANTITKTKPDISLDLSAIAKGFGVDQVASLLSERRYSDYMVEIGGEVVAHGTNLSGVPWQIGIDKPVTGTMPGQQLEAVVALSDRALATSGDYRNYRQSAGKRISHTIDPRTARPIAHKLASVSVLAKDCMTADAYATAINVLGDEEGMALAESQGLETYLIIHDEGENFNEKMTPGFARVLTHIK